MTERSFLSGRFPWLVAVLGACALCVALPAVAQQRMVLSEEFTATD